MLGRSGSGLAGRFGVGINTLSKLDKAHKESITYKALEGEKSWTLYVPISEHVTSQSKLTLFLRFSPANSLDGWELL